MKSAIALLFLFCCSNLFAGFIATNDPNNPIVEQFTCITMPKGGTHLLGNLIAAIAQKLGVEVSGEKGLYYTTHTMRIPPYKWDRRLKIILIRDPRDALVSCVEWVDRLLQEDKVSHWFQLYWPKMSFKDKVHTLIYPVVPEHLMVFEYLNIVPFFRDSNNLVIRFENLVGEKGGGSQEAQIQTIHEILDYLNIQFDREKIAAIASELWGSSYTFNKGIIGRWVEFLDDPEIKEWVNFRLGNVIQEFGYAESTNW